MDLINWKDFEKAELCAGTILDIHDFPGAIKPSFKLKIDFGPLGIKWSSAQLTAHYTKSNVIGKQIAAVINFPDKQITNFISECLVTGLRCKDIVLNSLDKQVPNGSKLI